MPRPPVRVLVVEPSVLRRQRLRGWLQGDPALHVVAAVADASQAIATADRRQAEVLVIGQGPIAAQTVDAVREVMQVRPTPIVVVAAAPTPVEEQLAFALIEAGALAVLKDPGPVAGAEEAALQELLTTVRLMAEVKVVRRWAALASTPPALASAPPAPAVPRTASAPAPAPRPMPGPRERIELVAIGASTGGPVALRQLLCALPASFPVPIAIVQHMSDGFLHGMADWLSASCALPTQMAAPGTLLRPGQAYLAPDNLHMRVGPYPELRFDAAPPVNGHRPAVSCLLASVATHYGARAIGILLTGMGKDGAAELKLLKDTGAVTIAQDEASSAVHGMPGEAIRIGGATYVMSPEEIGAALPALVLR
jgi:two-component system chemotaxis response regulator CheB